MAVSVDVLNLGETIADSAGSTVAVTTTAAAASGTTIVLVGCDFTASAFVASSAADDGPGLTWTVDKTGTSGNNHVWIVSAYASAGLASGRTITVTLSGSATGARALYATSFFGVDSVSRVGATSGPTDYTGTAWTSASTALSDSSMLVAVCNDFFTNNLATTTAPSVQTHYNGAGGSFALVSGHRIVGAAGNYVVAGTWDSASANGTTVAVEYKAAVDMSAKQIRASVPPVKFGPF